MRDQHNVIHLDQPDHPDPQDQGTSMLINQDSPSLEDDEYTPIVINKPDT